MNRAFLILLIFLNAGFAQNTVAVNVMHVQRINLDSLKRSLDISEEYDSAYFASHSVDTLLRGRSLVVSADVCTDGMLLSFAPVTTFDGGEYQYFLQAPGKTFADSLAFLRNNEILENWYAVHSRQGKIRKVERLGTDINIDFGQPVSIQYFNDGRLALYVNNYCKRSKAEIHLVIPEYVHGSPASLHCVIVKQMQIN